MMVRAEIIEIIFLHLIGKGILICFTLKYSSGYGRFLKLINFFKEISPVAAKQPERLSMKTNNTSNSF